MTKTIQRTPQVDIESDSDPTFLPAEEAADRRQLDQDMDRATIEADVPSRVGNPSHYETREERQVRIRRQFNQLDEHRSGFLDANSLVGFFAEVTPDKDVQRRYADELLQLCHSRKLYRHKNGHHHHHDQGHNFGTSEVTLEDHVSHGSAVDQGREGSEGALPDRHNGKVRYADFQVFVEEKEERLWNLFREIDHNNDNGKDRDANRTRLAQSEATNSMAWYRL